MLRERYLITKSDLDQINETLENVETLLGFIKQANDNNEPMKVEERCDIAIKGCEKLKHLLKVGDFE